MTITNGTAELQGATEAVLWLLLNADRQHGRGSELEDTIEHTGSAARNSTGSMDANLEGANLEGSFLEFTNIEGANLTNVNLASRDVGFGGIWENAKLGD